jgi:60 kDa SS-A/Ro ribonucleoprotein
VSNSLSFIQRAEATPAALNANRWIRLERFLIVGSETGTYVTGERELQVADATAVEECLREDGERVVAIVAEISTSGRAPKNTPALFVLAMATSAKFADARTNRSALTALPVVARTAGHLLRFAAFTDSMRGWGRGLRDAVANWYGSKPIKELAQQMLKYRERMGWSHADLLRLAHPKPAGAARNALYQWAAGDGELGHLASAEVLAGELAQLHGAGLAKRAADGHEAARLVEEYRLTHDMIPSKWKNDPVVWEALLHDMPYGAMLRYLGKLTAIGLIAPQSHAAALAVARLVDRSRIRHSRVHPMALLSALAMYKEGRGAKGRQRWTPVASVIDALDEAFYLGFENVEPAGSRLYIALDVGGLLENSAHVTAAAAMAMVFVRSEADAVVTVFDEGIRHLNIAKDDRLERVCEAITCKSSMGNSGASDTSLPMRDALRRGMEVDAFVIVTGNRSWAGSKYPAHGLIEYSNATGIATKLVVIAMGADRGSVVDPDDARQLGVAGFDATVPAVVRDFLNSGPRLGG